MLKRLEGDFADVTQQLTERRISGQIGPHYQRIDEDADQVLRFFAEAPGSRRTDREVLLAAVAPEQHLQGRQENHIERRPLLARDVPQPISQLGGYLKGL